MMSLIFFVVLKSSWPFLYSYQVSLLSDTKWQSYEGAFLPPPVQYRGSPDPVQNRVKNCKNLLNVSRVQQIIQGTIKQKKDVHAEARLDLLRIPLEETRDNYERWHEFGWMVMDLQTSEATKIVLSFSSNIP